VSRAARVVVQATYPRVKSRSWPRCATPSPCRHSSKPLARTRTAARSPGSPPNTSRCVTQLLKSVDARRSVVSHGLPRRLPLVLCYCASPAAAAARHGDTRVAVYVSGGRAAAAGCTAGSARANSAAGATQARRLLLRHDGGGRGASRRARNSSHAADDDVVDGNAAARSDAARERIRVGCARGVNESGAARCDAQDELHKEADEAHDDEAQPGAACDAQELCACSGASRRVRVGVTGGRTFPGPMQPALARCASSCSSRCASRGAATAACVARTARCGSRATSGGGAARGGNEPVHSRRTALAVRPPPPAAHPCGPAWCSASPAGSCPSRTPSPA
jgi:hypothetical protein